MYSSLAQSVSLNFLICETKISLATREWVKDPLQGTHWKSFLKRQQGLLLKCGTPCRRLEGWQAEPRPVSGWKQLPSGPLLAQHQLLSPWPVGLRGAFSGIHGFSKGSGSVFHHLIRYWRQCVYFLKWWLG